LRLSLAAVVLCAAACSGPEQYERGVRPVTPRPPTFRPHEDAPHTTGQPGARGHPGVSRGKDRRPLPASERPGVWASDSSSKTSTVVARMAEPPEVPEGLTEKAWQQCWADVQSCLLADPRAVRAGLNDYACLREQLVQACGAQRADRGAMGHRYTLGRYGAGYYDVGAFYAAMRPRVWGACAVLDSSKEEVALLYKALYQRCSSAWGDEGRK